MNKEKLFEETTALKVLEKTEFELLQKCENITTQLKKIGKQKKPSTHEEASLLLTQSAGVQSELRKNRLKQLAIYRNLIELFPECDCFSVSIKILETILAITPEPSK